MKVLATRRSTSRKILSRPTMTAKDMVEAVKRAAVGWAYGDVVSIGYPGPIWNGRAEAEPKISVINNAVMQAHGGYQGGHMLFLGHGTGLGSALVIDGVLAPMELAHLPYSKDRTYEHCGVAWAEALRQEKWRRQVGWETQALRRAGLRQC